MITLHVKKITALLAVFILLATLFGSLAPLYAAAKDSSKEINANPTNVSVSPDYIGDKSAATITFSFTAKPGLGGTYHYGSDLSGFSSEWRPISKPEASKTTLSISENESSGDASTGTVTYEAVISNIRYESRRAEPLSVTLSFAIESGGETWALNVPIDRKHFVAPKEDDTTDPDKPEVKSNIIIENVILFDKDNKELDKVTKDTPPFKVSILYQDSGLEQEDVYNLLDDSLQVFWNTEETEGFLREKNTKGTFSTRPSTGDGVPRFRADFDEVTFNEKDNTLSFKVRYRLSDGKPLEETVKAKIPQAIVPDKEKEEEEEDKIAPLKPHIIISQYSYGEDQIVAGSEFSLQMTFRNTSSEIPLENIVMTVAPPEDVSIASSSNTEYIPYLAAGGTQSHSLGLMAKPNAKVGSAEVEITFTYQYIDAVNKKREEGEFKEKIAIPITQIDRFEVDPITDIQEEAQEGETFYMTVKFINRGKSTTYNISASASGNLDMVTSNEHFGNLEAGKSGDVEIGITPNETGLLTGKVTIQYEDENANEKEIKMPYEVFIREPWSMQDMDPPDMDLDMEPEAPKMSKTSIALLVIGSLLVAIPIVIYFAKRAKQKGSGELYEDF